MEASIIIPAYNSCERLYNNLISLNHQNCSKNSFEVIVINNGSSDETKIMLSKFKHNFELRIINLDKNMGRSYARNCGIKNAKGKMVIFHDSDMIASPDYVSKYLQYKDNENLIVCGCSWKRVYTYYYKKFNGSVKERFNQIKRKKFPNKSIPYQKERYQLLSDRDITSGRYMRYVFDLNSFDKDFSAIVKKHGKSLKDYALPWYFFITNNCSASKQKLYEAGLFDENYIKYGLEDWDMGFRLYKIGCKFCSCDDILSVHQEHPTDSFNDIFTNILYMCEKFDSTDVYLFYMKNFLSIKNMDMNAIISEANRLMISNNYKFLLDVWKRLLIEVKDRLKAYVPVKMTTVDLPDYLDLKALTSEITKVEKNYQAINLTKAIIYTINDLYGIKI